MAGPSRWREKVAGVGAFVAFGGVRTRERKEEPLSRLLVPPGISWKSWIDAQPGPRAPRPKSRSCWTAYLGISLPRLSTTMTTTAGGKTRGQGANQGRGPGKWLRVLQGLHAPQEHAGPASLSRHVGGVGTAGLVPLRAASEEHFARAVHQGSEPRIHIVDIRPASREAVSQPSPGGHTTSTRHLDLPPPIPPKRGTAPRKPSTTSTIIAM